MPFRRLRSTFRTIRLRLAASNAAVILLTAWIVIFAVREGFRKALFDEIDEGNRGNFAEIVSMAGDMWDEPELLYREINRKDDSQTRQPWFAQLIDANGKELFASADRPLDFVSPNKPIETLAKSHEVQILEDSFKSPDGEIVVLRIGSSMAHIARRIGAIDFVGMLTTVAMLFIAPLVGYWLAGRAIRPLAEIIETTDRIRPERMDDRLPIRGTGDELDELSETINGLLDRLAVYLKNNREFLANAAHELRSPLAAVHSAIEVALGQQRSASEYEDLLGQVIERTNSLTNLINQLLLLAETESERLRVPNEGADLREIARRTVDMFEPVAETRNIELVFQGPAPLQVMGDSRHLRQVAMNLVDNALKFTPDGGRVDVELRSDALTQQAILRVRDTGMGIQPEELPHVFDRFFRGKVARHRKVGNGLGLSICHSIATACGGAIQVDSRLGQGTTFTVRLPLSREPRPLESLVVSH